MVEHTKVSRKTTNEDRIAICPQLGCETIKRVKPLRLGFIGFGKHPQCKLHHLSLVYVDERIGEVVDGALACLFDKAALPPKVLLTLIKEHIPEELNTFIKSWIYCTTIGRGASIISSYIDSLSNSYLKQITKKQMKALKDDTNIKSESKRGKVIESIKRGIDEITLQYTRLLKHLRAHSEALINFKEIQPLSINLKNIMNVWLETSLKEEKELLEIEEKQNIPLSQVKDYYDRILNLGTCRCLLGLPRIEKNDKKRNVSAFDRFSAYLEFWKENLTKKFTKSDIEALKVDDHKDSLKETLNLGIFSISVGNTPLDKLIQDFAIKLKPIVRTLKRLLDLRTTYAPTLKQIKTTGFKKFATEVINKSKELQGFNYLLVVNRLGLRLKKKWNILDMDDLGQRLLFDIENLPQFNDPSHPKYKSLPKGYAPSSKSIGWVNANIFNKRPYSYIDLVRAYGLKLLSGKEKFKDRRKFTLADWSKEYKKCRNMLIADGLIDFEPDEGMDATDFTKRSKYCNSLYYAARRASIDLYELGMSLGFHPRNPMRSYIRYELKDYATLLKKELDKGLATELKLRKDEAPSMTDLKRNRAWLWAAIKRSDFLYSDIIRTLSLKLYQESGSLRGIIGNYIHEITESLIIEITRVNNILSFKEVYPSKIDNLNVIDLLLIRKDLNKRFIEIIEKKQNIIRFPNNVELICIDITISKDRQFILEKMYKGYQGKGKFLIIVVFEERWVNLKIPTDVKFRENIKIIDFKDFFTFFGLISKDMQDLSKNLVNLVKSIRTFNDLKFLELERILRNAKLRLRHLEKKYSFRQKELERYLKLNSLYNLLKE